MTSDTLEHFFFPNCQLYLKIAFNFAQVAETQSGRVMANMYGNMWEGKGGFGGGDCTAQPACPPQGVCFCFWLPSSCQEAPQRATADDSALAATPSRLYCTAGRAFLCCCIATVQSKKVPPAIPDIISQRAFEPFLFRVMISKKKQQQKRVLTELWFPLSMD